MRITGGIYGGRILQSPKDRAIRPTSDKVRQAVFNILHARGCVVGAAILDAFCGTGALGIEALSRGGLCCTFMDKNPGSLDLAKQNHAALKIEAKSSFVLADASKPPAKPSEITAANLVFLDPPYNQDLITLSLPALDSQGWIAQNATILIEAEKSYDPSPLSAFGYDIDFTRDYGDTRIALAHRRD